VDACWTSRTRTSTGVICRSILAQPLACAPHLVMARATHERGESQPLERDADRRDAVINHVFPIQIEAR
jgi:hypothetical protein